MWCLNSTFKHTVTCKQEHKHKHTSARAHSYQSSVQLKFAYDAGFANNAPSSPPSKHTHKQVHAHKHSHISPHAHKGTLTQHTSIYTYRIGVELQLPTMGFTLFFSFTSKPAHAHKPTHKAHEHSTQAHTYRISVKLQLANNAGNGIPLLLLLLQNGIELIPVHAGRYIAPNDHHRLVHLIVSEKGRIQKKDVRIRRREAKIRRREVRRRRRRNKHRRETRMFVHMHTQKKWIYTCI